MTTLDPRALALRLWRIHGGDQHGPRIETLSMPLDRFDGFVDALSDALSQPQAGEPVQDTWFTDRTLPVTAMSADVEDNRVLKLHFRRPVTDGDRKTMCDALNVHQASLASPQPANPAQVTERAILALKLRQIPTTNIGDAAVIGEAADALAAVGAGGQAVDIVPEGVDGRSLVFAEGVLHVKKDGSGYIAVDQDDWQLEDDRCEGPDGPEGSVHWITRLDASEMQAIRDFLNGAALSQPHPADERVVEALRKAANIAFDEMFAVTGAPVARAVQQKILALSAKEGR